VRLRRCHTVYCSHKDSRRKAIHRDDHTHSSESRPAGGREHGAMSCSARHDHSLDVSVFQSFSSRVPKIYRPEVTDSSPISERVPSRYRRSRPGAETVNDHHASCPASSSNFFTFGLIDTSGFALRIAGLLVEIEEKQGSRLGRS